MDILDGRIKDLIMKVKMNCCTECRGTGNVITVHEDEDNASVRIVDVSDDDCHDEGLFILIIKDACAEESSIPVTRKELLLLSKTIDSIFEKPAIDNLT